MIGLVGVALAQQGTLTEPPSPFQLSCLAAGGAAGSFPATSRPGAPPTTTRVQLHAGDQAVLLAVSVRVSGTARLVDGGADGFGLSLAVPSTGGVLVQARGQLYLEVSGSVVSGEYCVAVADR